MVQGRTCSAGYDLTCYGMSLIGPSGEGLRQAHHFCSLSRKCPMMQPTSELSRREFLAASTGALAATGLAVPADAAPANSLAIDGGPKAVKERVSPLVRWGEAERQQLNVVVDQNSLFYWKGTQTKLLVERFREICPLVHVMTCSSGTAALHIAVAAAGIGPGDEVITSPITDIGTVIGTLFQQAVPVFADLGSSTYNLDPADVERRITPKTKAIIAVHLAGNPCDMAALKAIADKHKLVLIEDCAQAWGARNGEQPIGTLGHIACFSFQQAKHVTCGDGGIVASSDERFGPLLQRYGDKGMDRLTGGGLFDSFATNYRMSELQAAFAAAQLGRLKDIATKRNQTRKSAGRKNRRPAGNRAARHSAGRPLHVLVLHAAPPPRGPALPPGGFCQGACRGGSSGLSGLYPRSAIR